MGEQQIISAGRCVFIFHGAAEEASLCLHMIWEPLQLQDWSDNHDSELYVYPPLSDECFSQQLRPESIRSEPKNQLFGCRAEKCKLSHQLRRLLNLFGPAVNNKQWRWVPLILITSQLQEAEIYSNKNSG